MAIESFCKKMTLKVCWMLADGESGQTAGNGRSTWGVQARVEVCSLECFVWPESLV